MCNNCDRDNDRDRMTASIVASAGAAASIVVTSAAAADAAGKQ